MVDLSVRKSFQIQRMLSTEHNMSG